MSYLAAMWIDGEWPLSNLGRYIYWLFHGVFLTFSSVNINQPRKHHSINWLYSFEMKDFLISITNFASGTQTIKSFTIPNNPDVKLLAWGLLHVFVSSVSSGFFGNATMTHTDYICQNNRRFSSFPSPPPRIQRSDSCSLDLYLDTLIWQLKTVKRFWDTVIISIILISCWII